MAIRKSLFPLLVTFALLTSQISAAYIVFVPLAVAWMVVTSREGRLRKTFSSAPAALIVLQGLTIVLSTVFSHDPATSARHLAGVSLLLLLPIAIDLYREPSQPRAVLLALGISGFALSLDGFWQFAHGGNDLDNRIRATLSHWMTFSGLTMIAGCVLLGFAFEGRGRWRWVGLGAAVPLGAMLLTFTRNAYVGTLVAIALYLLLRRPRGLLFLPLALAAIFLLSPRSIQARIRSIASLEDVTNRDRISMLHAGGRMIANDPVFGVGPEMVKVYYPRYRDPDATEQRAGHLHNNVLQLAAANGLFAAASYVALMALVFARAAVLLRRENRPDQAALLAGALMAGAALFVAGFFEYNWGDTEVEMATLLVLAVPFSCACAPEPSAVSSQPSAVQRPRSGRASS